MVKSAVGVDVSITSGHFVNESTVVRMKVMPGFTCQWPGRPLRWRLRLVLEAFCAISGDLGDIGIDFRPPHCRSRQRFHFVLSQVTRVRSARIAARCVGGMTTRSFRQISPSGVQLSSSLLA